MDSIKSRPDNTSAVSNSDKVEEDEGVVVGDAGGGHPGPPRLLGHLGAVQGEVQQGVRVGGGGGGF